MRSENEIKSVEMVNTILDEPIPGYGDCRGYKRNNPPDDYCSYFGHHYERHY